MSSAPLISIPENECPEGGEAIFVMNGEVKLRVARWPPRDDLIPRGTVILAHGRTEFIEKYYEVIKDLRDRGFAVLSFDWRGQGLSTRELAEWQRGHINYYEDYLHDLDCLFSSPFTRGMPGPWVVLAHSMGGNIMLRYLHDHPDLAARAVLCAPMLGVGPPRLRPVMRLLVSAAIRLGRGDEAPFISKAENPAEEEFMGNTVTSDKNRHDRTKACVAAEARLVVTGLSWHWIDASVRSINMLWQPDFMAALKTPILLVQAGDERVVEAGAAERYAALSPACEVATIPGALHEIMMERNIYRDRFFALFDEFVSRD